MYWHLLACAEPLNWHSDLTSTISVTCTIRDNFKFYIVLKVIFKVGLWGLDWVFKYEEFVPVQGFTSALNELRVVENLVQSQLKAFEWLLKIN